MNVLRKKTCTTEEIDQLRDWFNAQTLPQSMQINSSASTPDLKKTVSILLEQAYVSHHNPKMQGCIRLLEKIKNNLEENQENA